jgi:pimeloyl-ACP methyl ester carboxylesterase
VPVKYVPVGGHADRSEHAESIATFVHHRGSTTLPGQPPDTSKGRTLLCLHDAGGNGNDFAALLDALAGAGHSPIAFDLPGHGRSGGLDSLGDVAAMAAHARALGDRLGVRRPVLVGDGMGAAVALEAAATAPTWPAALVLCGAVGARGQVPDEAIEQVRRVASGKARREFDASGYGPNTAQDIYQRAFMEWLKTDPRALLGDRVALQAWSVEGRLDRVTVPVLVVTGAHDDEQAAGRAAALADALSHGRRAALDGAAGHGVQERPVALAELIVAFLAAALDGAPVGSS